MEDEIVEFITSKGFCSGIDIQDDLRAYHIDEIVEMFNAIETAKTHGRIVMRVFPLGAFPAARDNSIFYEPALDN